LTEGISPRMKMRLNLDDSSLNTIVIDFSKVIAVRWSM
jgi:hypothetical protein